MAKFRRSKRHSSERRDIPHSQASLFRPSLEALNDINSDLVCLYRCVRHHLDEFVRMFRWSLVSREMFEWAQM
ncbi:hypothetical protein B1H32_22475, partial [Xanthomonas vasicola pv. vasculorum]